MGSTGHEYNEPVLLSKLREGDQRAFKRLYDHFKMGLANSLVRVLRDDELAKDVLQELFIRIWNNRETIDPQLSFKAYLYRIAQNLVVDYYRKAARDKSLQALMLQEEGWYSHVEEQLDKKENAAMLHALLQKLPEQQRRAYVLHKIEEKSHQEISEIMQISASTVNKHIHYAHRFVKAQLIQSPFYLRALLIGLMMTL